MARRKVVAVIVAHADDMEFMAGGTVARFVNEMGYDVYEYILTDNSKGSYRLSGQELVTISRDEAVSAGKVLGLKDVCFGDYRDSFLNEENPNVLRGKIMGFLREVKADIVMSWDPFAPYEEHPDHRVVSMVTLEAASFANIGLFYPEHTSSPYTVSEAYWFAKHPWNAETFVDISGVIDTKIDALLEHDCQMVLTVDGLVLEARAAGIDLPILRDVEGNGYRQVIAMGIRNFFGEIGRQAGMEYAEQFRYQKFGMLDMILGTELIKPDF
ncbi:MAG TPA: PIG-L family deacetylase [Candidatus Hydrogenedentes bacterium]|nr:PIG-L family deacetylase [Candidatus Hydrogenedentota bacterium]HPG65575.1 PIG-L family deacetylase [Candidatus Hydrogenedentota bacterium]